MRLLYNYVYSCYLWKLVHVQEWNEFIMVCIERNSTLVCNIPGRASCRKINLRFLCQALTRTLHWSEPQSRFGSNINRFYTILSRHERRIVDTRAHSACPPTLTPGAHVLSFVLCGCGSSEFKGRIYAVYERHRTEHIGNSIHGATSSPYAH